MALRSLCILCLAGLATASVGRARAEDALSARDLVGRLNHPSFSERERAGASLALLGRTAVPALQEGLQSADAEIRRRCAELLPAASRSDLEIQYDEFISGSKDRQPPFPGWLAFRQLAGDDFSARSLFVAIGRSDRALLETLEKDRQRVAAQLADRCQQLATRTKPRAVAQSSDRQAAIGAILLAAACTQDKNSVASQQFINSLYYPDMRLACAESAAARRLIAPFLARQLEESWRLYQTIWLARNLGLYEFMETTLKPEARKQALAAAAKAESVSSLSQAASIASMLGLQDITDEVIKPAAHVIAERLAEKPPDDPGQLIEAVNLLQSLHMQKTIDATLRLAACASIANVAERQFDQYRFHRALALARTLQLQDSIDRVLKPAGIRGLVGLSQQATKNPAMMHTAINLVQSMDLKEAGDDFLKPIIRRMSGEAAKSGDVAKLTQVAQFVNSLGITDGPADQLRDTLKRVAQEPTQDLTRINQLVALAQSLTMPETVERTLKPLAKKALLAAKDRPIGQNIYQDLQLARSLQLKEGVPLALKAAKDAKSNAWSRCNGIVFISEFGGKEHITELDKLLSDTTNVGSMGINFTKINTEIRDVALAAMISLSGDKLEDYGFPYVKMFGAAGPLAAHSAQCYGFSDANGRSDALKKWKERSKSGKMPQQTNSK
jgi:hypothetical protein